jgi:hypothetical protein
MDIVNSFTKFINSEFTMFLWYYKLILYIVNKFVNIWSTLLSIYNKHMIYIWSTYCPCVVVASKGLNLGLHIYNNETYRIPNHLKENP